MISRSEYDDRREERLREAKDVEFDLKWIPLRSYGVSELFECLIKEGDIRDTITILELQYDDVLEYWQINEMLTEAFKMFLLGPRREDESVDKYIKRINSARKNT